MPEYPILTSKEAEKILLDNGFIIDRQKEAIGYIKKEI